MFEVPSACLQAREIFKLIDFAASFQRFDTISICGGPEQRTGSVDYNPNHPILWDMLKNLVSGP